MSEWISPTIMREDHGFGVVTAPACIAGRIVVGRIDAAMCESEPAYPVARCGLVSGHTGAHWLCAEELIEKGGPFALMRSVVEDVTA